MFSFFGSTMYSSPPGCVHGNNSIASDQTICSRNIPASLTGTLPTGGNGAYIYKWQSSPDGLTFTAAPGINNIQDYAFPLALSVDTWYRRIVSSVGCPNDSLISNTVLITVLAAPCSDTLIGLSSGLNEYGHDIVVDSVNQWVYTVGAFEQFSIFPGLVGTDMNNGTGSNNLAGFLMKTDFKGNIQWAVNMGGTADDETTALTLAPDGNIYVTGFFEDQIRFTSVSAGFTSLNPGNQKDAFIASYNPAGDLQFADFGGGTGDDIGMGITSNASGVYVTGIYENSASFGAFNTEATYNNRINGFIAKYSFAGTPQALVEMKSDDDDFQNNQELRDVAYDIGADDGNIYVVGYMGGDNMRFTDSSGIPQPTPILVNTSNTPNTFICSYDTALGINWAVHIDDPSPNKRGFGVDVDCDGVYVAATIHNLGIFPSGTVINTIIHDLPLVMQLDLNTGIDQWIALLQTTNTANHEDLSHDVIADGYGNIYVNGVYSANDFLIPDTTLTPALDIDGFVCRFSNTGTFEWGRSYNGLGDDAVYAMASSGQDRLFVTGVYEQDLAMAPDTISGPNNLNILWGGMQVNSGGGMTQACCSVIPVGGTPSAANDTICMGDPVNLSLAGSAGNLQWESSIDGGINWVQIPLANGTGLTQIPTQSTEYRAIASFVGPGCIPDTSTTISIQVDSIPTPAMAGGDQNICGDTFAVLSGNQPILGNGIWTLLGGTGVATTPTLSNSIVTGLSSGSNSFTWTISNGTCPGSIDTVSLVVIDSPLVDLGPDTLVCAGDSLLLQADPLNQYPGASFLWASGKVTPSVYAAVPNTYSVLVDTLGCVGRDTIVVSFSATPGAVLPNDTSICTGDSLELNANPNGTNSGANFSWSTGDTLAILTVNTTGQYYVDVSYGGCPPASDTINIVELAFPMVDLGPDTLLCPGDSLVLNADPGGMYPTATFTWSTGANTTTLNVSTANTYIVKIDTAGCLGEDTILIGFNPTPMVTLPGDTSICTGDSIQLNANLNGTNTGANFNWSTGDTSAILTANSTGQYYVDVFYTGCPPASDTMNILSLPVPVVDLGADTLLCPGNNLILNADPAGIYPTATYSWSTGGNSSTLNVTSANTYIVNIDTGGCLGSDTILIGYNPTPIATLPGDTSICEGDSIDLEADPNGLNPGALITWSTGDSLPLITIGNSGVYFLDISYPGCPASSDTIEVVQNLLPVVNLGTDTILCNGDSLLLNADPLGAYPGAVYSWAGGGTMQTQFVLAGTWSVTLTDANGCSRGDTIEISASGGSSISFTGLDPVYCSSDTGVQLNPNPIGGSFSGPGVNGMTFDPSVAGIGIHLVTYTFIDSVGCINSALDSTQIDDPIVANAGPDQEVYFTDQASLEGNSPLPGNGIWMPLSSNGTIGEIANENTTVSGLDMGTNTFSWTIFLGGCSSSDEVTLIRFPFVPERVFTPNGDGYNDYFVLPGLEDYPGSSVEIFTRWGELIFKSEDYQNDWQGTNPSGQLLQDDTYYYVLTLNTGVFIKGYVELKR